MIVGILIVGILIPTRGVDLVGTKSQIFPKIRFEGFPNATSRGPMGPQTNIKNNLRSPGFSAFWMYVLFFVQLKF